MYYESLLISVFLILIGITRFFNLKKKEVQEISLEKELRQLKSNNKELQQLKNRIKESKI